MGAQGQTMSKDFGVKGELIRKIHLVSAHISSFNKTLLLVSYVYFPKLTRLSTMQGRV